MKNRISFLFALGLFLSLTPAMGQQVPKSTGSKVSQQDAQDALNFHNKVRKDVGTPPLEWSPEIAKYAQAWADHLANDKGCQMEHRPNDGEWKRIYGENIFWGSGASYNAKDASDSWYSEIKDYKHEVLNNSNWYAAGHYTQMVWRNTTKVGIGQATCPNGATIIVGNYDPPGNYLGEKAY
ncbi:MAG TPA: SCP-like extracellular [Cytophagales bacterium]|jgi:pathogenesis-related protein 1|nr:SCP-like extracellular [Cytophagales bacterium]